MENDKEKKPKWQKISLVKWGTPSLVTEEDNAKDGVKEERERILDKICHPREWWGAGQFWRQHLSADPVNRLDVIELSQELDLLLNEHVIRDTGICDIRQHIYKQLFNEVTRQITLYCVQQGSLLVRIRDEIWMMQDFYKKMYENSLAFIIRKTEQVVEHQKELQYLLAEMKIKKENKLQEIRDLQKITEDKVLIMDTCRSSAEEYHKDIVQNLESVKNAHKKQLQKYLESVVTVKGAK